MFTVRRGRDAIEPSPLFDDVWKVYSDLSGYERHFNDLQARYRALASTWLLATFAGIGFVLSKKFTEEFPVAPFYLSAGLSLAGAIGITLLWNLDQMVYFSLLESAFREGMLMERKHEWLPPIRKDMLVLSGDQGVRRRTACFYIAGVAILLAIAVSFTAYRISQYHDWQLTALISIIGFAMTANWSAYMWRSNLQQDWRSYSVSHHLIIDAPVETVFEWLINEEKVAKWATNIKELRPDFTGQPSEGAEWIVADEKNVGRRVIEMFDDPYGLTVRFKVPGRRIRRSYRLMHVAQGSKLSAREQRYDDAVLYRIFLLLLEPFWIFSIPFTWSLLKKPREQLEREMEELKNDVEKNRVRPTTEESITDQYAAAVIMLGSRDESKQLGGIYALGRILRESSRYHTSIVKILAAFIREQAPIARPANNSTSQVASPAPVSHAAQEALTVLAGRPRREESFRVDLRGIDLYKINLRGAYLSRAIFSACTLQNATLQDADLTGADLVDANLQEANLNGACLRGAALHGANLQRADLTNVDLEEALLMGANMRKSKMDGRTVLSSSIGLTFAQAETIDADKLTEFPKEIEEALREKANAGAGSSSRSRRRASPRRHRR